MPMSDSYPELPPTERPGRRPDCYALRSRWASGFTLLEVLVALTILGFVTLAVTPKLASVFDSVTYAMNRGVFEKNLSALTYQALSRGEDLVLTTIDPYQQLVRSRPLPQNQAIYVKPAELPLPEGWALQVLDPIIYRSTGYCVGGVVTAVIGTVTEEYVLAPPMCVAQRKS